MKYMRITLTLFTFFTSISVVVSQNTHVVYLNQAERANLQALYQSNTSVRNLGDSVINEAKQILHLHPKPIAEIYYEGRLETDTARIRSRKSLYDMDKVSTWFYASYVQPKAAYSAKIKEFVLAWAKTYRPDGNTINENKFNPLMWGYYLFKKDFSEAEQKIAEDFFIAIAEKQLGRKHTPNNNWEAKRLRLIGLVGGITGNQDYIDYAIKGLKQYINTAYHADGTSNDLRKRDALHYHISGLKILLASCINLSSFDTRFQLFDFESPSGSSIKKSVLYTLPYALGEKTHREWVNSQVQLDKERAAAGLPEYQPGLLFDKEEADPLFEWAVYFNPKWYKVLDEDEPKNYAATWIGLLNSPWVRDRH